MREVLYEILDGAYVTAQLWDQGALETSREEWTKDYCA